MPEARERFRIGSEAFPFQASFRKIDAYYMIWWNVQGLAPLDATVASVKKALQTMPNSDYLQAHLMRLTR